MGQHKSNPIAIAAKNGDLPPKPKRMSKRERERLLYASCQKFIYERFAKVYVKAQRKDGEDDGCP